MKIAHFYHVYADGNWEDIAQDHVRNLEYSGLLGELDDMFLGIVGSKANRDAVRRELPGVVVAEADEGWEQLTLQALHDYAQENQAKVFYAHTKGAWSSDPIAEPWRVSMTHDTVTRWQECASMLNLVEAVGPFWIESLMPEHRDHEHFFGGNFWWARSTYLAKLEPVKTEHRYQAEGWIGLGTPSIFNMRPGNPTWGNFWQPF